MEKNNLPTVTVLPDVCKFIHNQIVSITRHLCCFVKLQRLERTIMDVRLKNIDHWLLDVLKYFYVTLLVFSRVLAVGRRGIGSQSHRVLVCPKLLRVSRLTLSKDLVKSV